MDEETFQEWLMEVLNTIDDEDESPAFNIATTKVRTFEDIGMLTRDKGLMVTLTDDSKFYLTIKKTHAS